MCLIRRRPVNRTVVVTHPPTNTQPNKTMKTLELFSRSALQLLLAACAATLCIRLCTGCAYLKDIREQSKPTVAFALKEAYALGGAEAVSNKIERLVVDGKVTPAQAAQLHVLAQRLFDGVVDRLEADALDAALAPTNAPAAAAR